MSKIHKGPGRPPADGNRAMPVTIPLRVSCETLAEIDAVIEGRGGGQSRNSLMREAMAIGLRELDKVRK